MTQERRDRVPYTSELQGITVEWRGSVTCDNLSRRLDRALLQFIPTLNGVQYRIGVFRPETLEHLDKGGEWRICENGEHQVYFDLVRQIQRPRRGHRQTSPR